MNGGDQITLTPWYRGFSGFIRKVSSNKWITKGRYKVLDDSTIEITELPIGYWTQNFKELLEMYEKGYKLDSSSGHSNGHNTADKKKKISGSTGTGAGANARKPKWVEFADNDGKLIKSFKNESSDSQIKFTLKFESEILNKLLSGVDKTGLSELEKLFQLTTTLTCGNTMNLYDENNKLKKFNSPEEILAYYYAKRLEYYELRRQNLIKILDQDLLLLSTRARFILDVINDAIKVRNIPEAEIIKQLHTCKYSIMVDSVLFEYEKYDKLTYKQKTDGSYDFLIAMPIRCMTKEKVEELLKEKEKRSAELEILKKKTDKDLWEEDLKVFEHEYKKHMDDFYEYTNIDPKSMEKSASKIINRKVTVTKKLQSTTSSMAPSVAQSNVASDDE
jgi:DNA topoisomerase-2